MADLHADIPSHVPKTILTVPSSLSHGFSRQLFVDFAKEEKNVVILTGKSEVGSLSRWLWGEWEEKQEEGERWGGGKVGSVVRLEGELPVPVSVGSDSWENRQS